MQLYHAFLSFLKLPSSYGWLWSCDLAAPYRTLLLFSGYCTHNSCNKILATGCGQQTQVYANSSRWLTFVGHVDGGAHHVHSCPICFMCYFLISFQSWSPHVSPMTSHPFPAFSAKERHPMATCLWAASGLGFWWFGTRDDHLQQCHLANIQWSQSLMTVVLLLLESTKQWQWVVCILDNDWKKREGEREKERKTERKKERRRRRRNPYLSGG